jgi:hypothetical protein
MRPSRLSHGNGCARGVQHADGLLAGHALEGIENLRRD